MPAGSTYSTIATATASGSSTNITFSSIPGTYTDLRLVILIGATNSGNTFNMQFNGDTASNYSQTELWGDGTTASSARRTSQSSLFIVGSRVGASTGLVNISLIDIMNYSNTTTFKTVLNRQGAASLGTLAAVGLWRKTPEAITSISIDSNSAGNISANSVFTLYGIAAA